MLHANAWAIHCLPAARGCGVSEGGGLCMACAARRGFGKSGGYIPQRLRCDRNEFGGFGLFFQTGGGLFGGGYSSAFSRHSVICACLLIYSLTVANERDMPKKTNPSFDETVKGLAPEVLAAFVQYLRSRNFGEDSILFLLGYSSDAAKMTQPRKAKMGAAKAAKLRYSLTQALSDFLAQSQQVVGLPVLEPLQKAMAWMQLTRWEDAAQQLFAAWQAAIANEYFGEMELIASLCWRVKSKYTWERDWEKRWLAWEEEYALWNEDRYKYGRLLVLLEVFRKLIGERRNQGGLFAGDAIQLAIEAYSKIGKPVVSNKAQLLSYYLGVYCFEWQGKKSMVQQLAAQLTSHIQTRPQLIASHPEIVFRSYRLCITLFLDLGNTDLAISVLKCFYSVVEKVGSPPNAVWRLILACLTMSESQGDEKWAMEAEELLNQHNTELDEFLKDQETIRLHFFRLKIAAEQGRLDAVRDPIFRLHSFSRTTVKWDYQMYTRLYEIAIAWLREDWAELSRLIKYAQSFLLRNPDHAQYPFAQFLIGWFGKLAKGKAKTPLPLQLQQFEMDFQAKCGQFVPEGNYLNLPRLILAKYALSNIIPNVHRA